MWQFDLPGVEEVLKLLRSRGPWMQLSFFLNAHGLLDGKSPLEASRANGLQPRLSDVKRAAAAVLREHG